MQTITAIGFDIAKSTFQALNSEKSGYRSLSQWRGADDTPRQYGHSTVYLYRIGTWRGETAIPTSISHSTTALIR